MDFSWLINVVVAAVAGASSGFFAPWFAWKLDKARELRSHRRNLVGKWRDELLDVQKISAVRAAKNGAIAVNSGIRVLNGQDRVSAQFAASFVIGHRDYASLEGHLSDNFKSKLTGLTNTSAIVIDAGGIANPRPHILNALADEIFRIEKHWDLV